MIRLRLTGKITLTSQRGRLEVWECSAFVDEPAPVVDRRVTGYGSTPAEAIAHARKTMRDARYERSHPKAWDVGVRYSFQQVVDLARAAHTEGSGYPEWRAEQFEKRRKPGVGPCEKCGDVGPLYRRPRGKLHMCKDCAEGSK